MRPDRWRIAARAALPLVIAMGVLAPSAHGFRPGPSGPRSARAAPPSLAPRMAAAVDSHSQRMPLLFPPSVRPTSIVYRDDKTKIWTLEQPFITTTNIKTRMTVMDLGKDARLLYSPIAATEECVAMVRQALGGRLPTHILMQNDAVDHTLFLPGWRRAAPEAQVLAVKPDARRGDLPLLSPDGGSQVQLPPELLRGGALEAALLDVGPFFQEVVLLHRPSRSVLCADAVWRVVSDEFFPNVVAATGWQFFGVSRRSRFPYPFYAPRRKRAEVQAFCDQVDSWGEIRRVLTGHLDPIPNAAEAAAGMPSAEVKRVFLGSFDYIVR